MPTGFISRRWMWGLTAAVLALVSTSVAQSQDLGFRVVVHEDNPVESVSLDELSEYFLKRQAEWDHGTEVQPVDQRPSANVRRRFSTAVFDKQVAWIKSYWQKQIFSGRGTPPPELPSDSEVVSFVRRNPGAIGYVATGTSLGDGVKSVTVTR